MTAPKFPGIFLTAATGAVLKKQIALMTKAMVEWTMQAARGECEWICTDCGASFADGMPDECAHGQQACTDIIKRDKAEAKGEA